jgi:hypothetical protein
MVSPATSANKAQQEARVQAGMGTKPRTFYSVQSGLLCEQNARTLMCLLCRPSLKLRGEF